MSDREPLDPISLPLAGIQLIEASAGTGKTWTIAALYLRLVLGHECKPLLPAQILVMTFTKAATAELRERIRTRLADAAHAFRHPDVADAFVAELIAAYADDARASAASRLELAAQCMDEAAVFTIHGWCQRMLTQHAFASGEAPDSNIIADEAELLDEVVADYWRTFVAPLRESAAHAMLKLWATPAKLQHAVQPLLALVDNGLLIDGQPVAELHDPAALLGDSAQKLEVVGVRAKELWRKQGTRITALLQKAASQGELNKSSYKADTLDNDHVAFDDWAAGGELPGGKVLERHTTEKLKKATNNGHATPTHAFFKLVDELHAAQAAADNAKPWLLAHATTWMASRLDDVHRQRNVLGYDDMLQRLDKALHGNHGDALATLIAEQYPAALIDEFQDTDPLQWHSLQRIFAGTDDTALLLIGDPKQAIYGFRGADIEAYFMARTAAAEPTWTLHANHRSSPALVAAVNRVFSFADKRTNGAFRFDEKLPFQPVESTPPASELHLGGKPIDALQLAACFSDTLMNLDTWRETMAAHAAAQVVKWLDAPTDRHCTIIRTDNGEQRPLRASDIAILVRTGKEADLIRAALRTRGLASVYLSDRDSVYSTTEARDLLRWLHACAQPGADRPLRAAMATLSMAHTIADLTRLGDDEAWRETCDSHFRDLNQLWQRHGVLAMLHELLHRFGLPARLLARDDGERALTNLLHLAELLQQASTGLDGDNALIRYLAAQIDDPACGESADAQIVRLESEAALVKVVTIHKSKGLEYPVVLLPFACGFRAVKSKEPLRVRDQENHAHFDLVPDSTALADAEIERLREDLRLFYVAITRACHACWIGVACPKIGNQTTGILHKSAFGYLLAGGNEIKPEQLKASLDALRGDCTSIAINSLPKTADSHRHRAAATAIAARPARTCTLPIRRLPWWVASYSALAHHDGVASIAAPETANQSTLAETVAIEEGADIAPTTHSIHDFQRGALAGTFLHELLELCADEGFARAAKPSARLRETLQRRCSANGWQAWEKPLAQWLRDFVQAPLPLPGGERMALAALDDGLRHRAEMEFWFEANRVDTRALDHLVTAHTLDGAPRVPLANNLVNGMLKGFIDLTFEHAGRWYVVDYKSNKLGASTAAYTAQAMRDSVLQNRYDLQYAIYTLALHRQLQARLPGYDYDKHMGGVVYLYLRGVDDAGHGVHAERLPFALVEALDRLFAHGDAARAA